MNNAVLNEDISGMEPYLGKVKLPTNLFTVYER